MWLEHTCMHDTVPTVAVGGAVPAGMQGAKSFDGAVSGTVWRNGHVIGRYQSLRFAGTQARVVCKERRCTVSKSTPRSINLTQSMRSGRLHCM